MKLPLEIQFKILDMLRMRYSVRKIAKILHVSKTTVMDCKKRGIPFYRNLSPNIPADLNSASWQEERKLFIQTIKEAEQNNKQLIDQKNKDKRKIQDLTQDNNQKDKKIEMLTQKSEEYQREIQKKDQQIENIKQENENDLQKQNTDYEDIKTERDTYKNKCDVLEKKFNLLEDELLKTKELHQVIQTTRKTTPLVNGDTNYSSIDIPNEVLLYLGIITGGALAIFLANHLKKPAMPMLSARTPQHVIPIKFRYDQKKATLMDLSPTNGVRNIPDHTISIGKEHDQSRTNETNVQHASDQPIKPNQKNSDEKTLDQKTNKDTRSMQKT